MILEMLDYILTPASRQARKMGYLGQSIGLKYRFKRCRRFWKSHLAACEKVIIKAVEKTKRKETVMILGSGDLQEMPLEYLVAHFRKIILVDIVHSRSIQKLVKNHPQFESIQIDLNGFSFQKVNKENPWAMLKGPPSLPPADLIISANLLSQLPLKPCDFLRKKKVAEELIEQFGQDLQRNHIEWLRTQSALVLIYSDYELEFRDKNNFLLETKRSVLVDLVDSNSEKWDWELAPIPEFDKNIGLRMKVFGQLIQGQK